MPDNEMRAEVLDDPRAWNLGRSRAEQPLTDLGLLPPQAGTLRWNGLPDFLAA